jgi:hypothetical protein
MTIEVGSNTNWYRGYCEEVSSVHVLKFNRIIKYLAIYPRNFQADRHPTLDVDIGCSFLLVNGSPVIFESPRNANEDRAKASLCVVKT